MAVMTTVATESQMWVPELTFGARLALVRHRMGWNQKEAAAACGLPAQSWRGWEAHGHLPRRYVDIAKQISGATGVDYLWLVHGPDRGQGGTDSHLLAPMSPRLVATIGGPRTGEPSRGVTRTRPLRSRDQLLRTRARAAIAAAA